MPGACSPGTETPPTVQVSLSEDEVGEDLPWFSKLKEAKIVSGP